MKASREGILGTFLVAALLIGCTTALVQPETADERFVTVYQDIGAVVDSIAAAKRAGLISGEIRDELLDSIEVTVSGLNAAYDSRAARKEEAIKAGRPIPVDDQELQDKLDTAQTVIESIQAALDKAKGTYQ